MPHCSRCRPPMPHSERRRGLTSTTPARRHHPRASPLGRATNTPSTARRRNASHHDTARMTPADPGREGGTDGHPHSRIRPPAPAATSTRCPLSTLTLDAAGATVQTLHRQPADGRRRRYLPPARHRRGRPPLPGRVRAPPQRAAGVPDARPRSPAVRGDAHRRRPSWRAGVIPDAVCGRATRRTRAPDR